ncbi:MAG: hypothetical protein ACOC56_05000, partial [Atribacterota bacterium]
MLYFSVWGTPIFSDIKTIIHALRQETGKMHDIKQSGNTLLVTCPFHSDGMERTPSMAINLRPKKDVDGNTIPAGVVHCFSDACNYTSDLPHFISDLFNKNDDGMFGFRWLLKNFVTGEYKERKIDININRGGESEVYSKELDISKYIFNYEPLKGRGIERKLMYMYNVRYDKNSHAFVFPVYDFNNKIIGVHKKGIVNKWYNKEGEV